MRTNLEILKEHFFTLEAIARAAGVKYQHVQQWNPEGIPPQYVLVLCEASAWAITPHMLRPDLYPNADDALPQSMRGLRNVVA